jgi:hypothetical protein
MPIECRRAGGDDRQVRALEAEHDRDMAGDHVDDRRGHEERRDPAWPALLELGLGVLDQRQAADARADQAADALGLLGAERVVGRQAGVAHRLDRRGEAVVDERVHVTRFLGREIVLDVEALDLAGEAAGEGRGVELGDVGDAGAARQQILPAFGNAVADRADQAEAGDDDTARIHRAGPKPIAQAAFWCFDA